MSTPSPTAETSASSAATDLGRLLVSCPDRPGISAAVTGYLFGHGANITDFQQFSTDPVGGQFFLRVEFVLAGLEPRLPDIEAGFTRLEAEFAMRWRFALAAKRKRLAILVSKADHALQELLSRHQAGDLAADIEVVISNHRDVEAMVNSYGVAFHHVPVTAETKEQSETQILELLHGRVDTVVLARYMQVLSPRFLAAFPNEAINIHHSFLPAFAGADPYAQAADRGVKLIGATAHYVTEELDAGPIIEQDVARVDHRQSVADMRRAGRYVERAVLARAVGWHVEDRVIIHGNKTIVFA
jgi:formyltetrahydrofolate deformylase